ncbi:MAG: redoxin domain-containing protein, partial [Actinobacteria bacterium]|nr:redoxin domain-containing protein [Actinomycetota bacterium]
MSQSPAEAHRVQRYEEAWEAINRMIREDLSWSGRERNCLHVALRDGTFANISAASGVDYLDDGRALGVLDADRDGRPDLVLRNRTAPMVRLLQNTWPDPGESLWLRLEGASANRDAIGARIHARTSHGVRIKEVQAGNLFLSQSSRWIPIGLPPGTSRQVQITVRWPGGGEQDLGLLETGRRYLVRQGEPPRAELYESTADYGSAGDADRETAADGRRTVVDDSPAIATWLIEPVTAPDFAITPVGVAGAEPIGPASFRGRPLFLHFISTTCGVCISEAPAMRRAERAVEKAGAAFLHVVVNATSEPETVRAYVERMGFHAPAVQADERTLRAYNVLHRQIWNLRRDLAVPTVFLLDAAGSVARVYRGTTRPEELALDVSHPAGEWSDLAQRFPGIQYSDTFRRDLIALGNAYLEAGLEDLARETFRRSVERETGDVDSLFNFAVANERAGQLEEAREAYRKVLALAPGSDDARNNLGVLLARDGETG